MTTPSQPQGARQPVTPQGILKWCGVFESDEDWNFKLAGVEQMLKAFLADYERACGREDDSSESERQRTPNPHNGGSSPSRRSTPAISNFMGIAGDQSKESLAGKEGSQAMCSQPETDRRLIEGVENLSITYYGPHPCESCGGKIVRGSVEQGFGDLRFDYPEGIVYPNQNWTLHRCPPKPASPPLVTAEQAQLAWDSFAVKFTEDAGAGKRNYLDWRGDKLIAEFAAAFASFLLKESRPEQAESLRGLLREVEEDAGQHLSWGLRQRIQQALGGEAG